MTHRRTEPSIEPAGRSALNPADHPRVSARAASSPVHGVARDANRLRIIVADRDPLARRAICDHLRRDGGFVVVAEASNGSQAAELATHYRPELVLIEISMPAHDCLAACRVITTTAPEVRVVAISASEDREIEIRALRAGASGFLSKNASIESILRALRAVTGGEAAVTRSLTFHLVELLRTTSENGIGMRPVKSPLTTREWEVLDLICAGHSTREISAKLFLSEATVYSHTKNILRKLGVHSRSDAVAAAGQLRR